MRHYTILHFICKYSYDVAFVVDDGTKSCVCFVSV